MAKICSVESLLKLWKSKPCLLEFIDSCAKWFSLPCSPHFISISSRCQILTQPVHFRKGGGRVDLFLGAKQFLSAQYCSFQTGWNEKHLKFARCQTGGLDEWTSMKEDLRQVFFVLFFILMGFGSFLVTSLLCSDRKFIILGAILTTPLDQNFRILDLVEIGKVVINHDMCL